MKYRTKQTGIVVDALYLNPSIDVDADILDFGKGLIQCVKRKGRFLQCVMLELTNGKIYCNTGDYLIKNQSSICYMPGIEFERGYEKVEEGEQMKFITRKIYYTVSFENDNVPYREGIYYSTTSASSEMPECKFISIFYNDLKEEISKAQYQELKNLKQLDINKIEIVTDKHECHIKECGVVETELPKKNILDPVENVITSIEAKKERTVRDCILDVLTAKEAEKIKMLSIIYLQNVLSGISKCANKGASNKIELEKYAKLSDGLADIRLCSITELLDYTEKDMLKLLGLTEQIPLKSFILEQIEEGENSGR